MANERRNAVRKLPKILEALSHLTQPLEWPHVSPEYAKRVAEEDLLFLTIRFVRVADEARRILQGESDAARTQRRHGVVVVHSQAFSDLAEKVRSFRCEAEQMFQSLMADLDVWQSLVVPVIIKVGPGILANSHDGDEEKRQSLAALSSLDEAVKVLAAFSRMCGDAAFVECKSPLRGAPRKSAHKLLALAIRREFPIGPMPGKRTGDKLEGMTDPQKMGALCQTLGLLAGLDEYANTLPAWVSRLKKITL